VERWVAPWHFPVEFNSIAQRAIEKAKSNHFSIFESNKKMNYNSLIKVFEKDGYLLSTDRRKLDIKLIHEFLTHSYWAEGISIENVQITIDNSLCFGLYHEGKQIGFANVLSDFGRVAHLYNVFIVEEYRGKGLAIWMLNHIFNLAELSKVKKWLLGTKDRQSLYAKFGFHVLTMPERLMEMRVENKQK
jgi:N-acetylglutamate synthase-like GNAT family acetyltransferase